MLVLVALLFSVTTSAAAFEPVRYAFLPKLTLNRDGEVCRPFINAVTAAFKSWRPRFNLYGGMWLGVDMEWLLPVPPKPSVYGGSYTFPLEPGQASAAADQAQLTIVPADVDHDYKNEQLVLADWGSYPPHHALVLYPDREKFDWALTAVHTFEAVFKRAVDLTPPDVSEGQAGRSAIAQSTERLSVLRIGRSFYVLAQGDARDHAVFSLSRIRVDQEPETVCEIQALSDPAGFSLGPLSATPVATLAGLLTRISGQPVNPRDPFDTQHQYILDRAAAHRALLVDRPWALGLGWPSARALIMARLTAWGEISLTNRRMVRELLESIPAATATLADFYARSYGLSSANAAEAAETAISVLIADPFNFVGGNALARPVVRPLEHALLHGASPGEIEHLLKMGEPIATGYTLVNHQEEDWPVRTHVATEPTLFYALEVPANVSVLLATGTDPNAKGNFDKTALMYAAQFDLPETARVLLDHGADVNARTNANPMIDANIVHDQRTALMYAAENGSRAMIELLLERAADPTAKDSTGRNVFDYLGRNTQFSALDRATVAQEIQAVADRVKP
jgi:hypothetical protein